MLIYRGESRFDLKGVQPVKLPLLLKGQSQIIAVIECKQAPITWRVAGTLEQFAFYPSVGMVTVRRFRLSFRDPQLLDLEIEAQSFLRFAPVNYLKFRVNIQISDLLTV